MNMRLAWVLLLTLVSAVPLLATYLYVNERELAGLLQRLLSLLLFIALSVTLAARVRPYLARLLLLSTLLFLLLCYQFATFLAEYFLGTGFGEAFLYHFNLAVLGETWWIYRDVSLTFIACTLVLLLIAARSMYRVMDKPLRPAISAAVYLPVLLLALLLDPEARRLAVNKLETGQAVAPLSMINIDWQAMNINPGAIGQDNIRASAGKNLVLVFLEGLERIYTEERIFPGLTPFLDQVMASGLHFSDMRQVAGSEWTVGGMVASLCGTPLLHQRQLGGNSILFSRFLDQAVCFGDVLAEAGYRQHFMGGASTGFAGKGAFLEAHGYDSVLGREQLLPLLEEQSYRNDWGLYDDSLFSLALAEFNRLAAGTEPFNLTLLTLDTHHPDGFPSASCPPYPGQDNSILHAVHCTDTLLREFITQLQAHPRYQDTLVVLVSDHLSMRNAAHSLFPADYPRRLLFTVLNADEQGEITQPGVPMDIAPTLLDLLAVEHDAGFLAGSSLSARAEEIQNRDVAVFDAARRREILRYLNSTQLSSVAEDVCAARQMLSGAQRNGLRVGDTIIPLDDQGVPINKARFAEDFIAVAAFDQKRVLNASHVLKIADWSDFAAGKATEKLLLVGRQQILSGLLDLSPQQSAEVSAEVPAADAGNIVVAIGSVSEGFTLLGNFATLADISIPASHCQAAFSA